MADFTSRFNELLRLTADSDTALADALGVSKQTISAWKTGARVPIQPTRRAIASHFNVSIQWLEGLTDTLHLTFDPSRVESLCAQKGITMNELAQAIGVKPALLDRMLSPGAIPSGSYLAKIADALGCSIDYLMSRDDGAHPLPSNVRSIQSLHRQVIPVIGEVAAGEPIYAPEELGVYVDSPVDADAAMTVKGDSMSPGYQDGDIVYIKCRPDVQEGMIAVVFLDDEAVIKRVYKRSTGLTLVSDNSAYSPIIAEFEDYTNMRIFGVPVGYTRIYKNRIEGKIKKGMV